MKIKLLACVAFLGLISCSEDSETIVITPEKSLFIMRTYNNDGNEDVDQTIVFENNKPENMYEYLEGVQLLRNTAYTYNEAGLLMLEEIFDNQGGHISKKEILYNTSGNISKIVDTNYDENGNVANVFSYDYIYSDNTITCNLTLGENEPQLDRVFYINGQGKVEKIVFTLDSSTTITQQAVFQGNNIISIATGPNIIEYIYNTTQPVKGDYLKMYRNQLGNDINLALYNAYNYLLISSDNYLASWESMSGNSGSFDYTFDDEGYPVNIKNHRNNELQSETELIYN